MNLDTRSDTSTLSFPCPCDPDTIVLLPCHAGNQINHAGTGAWALKAPAMFGKITLRDLRITRLGENTKYRFSFSNSDGFELPVIVNRDIRQTWDSLQNPQLEKAIAPNIPFALPDGLWTQRFSASEETREVWALNAATAIASNNLIDRVIERQNDFFDCSEIAPNLVFPNRILEMQLRREEIAEHNQKMTKTIAH